MKQLRWMFVMAIIGILSACGGQATKTPDPPISTDSLETAEGYLVRGDSYCATKDYGLAILAYNEAIRLDPDYAEAYNNRGYAYYWNGNAAQAIADYSRAIALRPNYAYAYNNRGATYMASGHPKQAILDFDSALELQTEFPQAHINRGNAYLRLGRFDLAFQDFHQGGANPVRMITLVSGTAALIILFGIVIMNIARQHLSADKPRAMREDRQRE